MADPRPLNERQLRFIEAYLVDPNGAAAARAAGYTEKRCYVTAHDLLQDPRIVAALAAARAERSARARKSADDVLAELERIAFSDLRKVANWTKRGLTLVPSAELEDEAAAAIAEVKVKPGDARPSLGIKLHDKLKALQLLGEHHGLFEQKGGDDDSNHDADLDELDAREAAIPPHQQPQALAE